MHADHDQLQLKDSKTLNSSQLTSCISFLLGRAASGEQMLILAVMVRTACAEEPRWFQIRDGRMATSGWQRLSSGLCDY